MLKKMPAAPAARIAERHRVQRAAAERAAAAPAAAAPAERPLIDTAALRNSIVQNMRWAREYRGSYFKVGGTKYKGKWWPIAKKLVFGGASGWLILKPAKLFDSITDFEDAGAIAWARGKFRSRWAKKLRGNQEVRVRAREVWETYKKRQFAALDKLQRALDAHQVRPDNAGDYLHDYNKAMAEAQLAFKGGIGSIIKSYGKTVTKWRVGGRVVEPAPKYIKPKGAPSKPAYRKAA